MRSPWWSGASCWCQHKRQKYACSCHAVVNTAPGPLKLIEGGRYSIDFAIEVAARAPLQLPS